MKHLLTLLAALTILVSPAAAQTIKSLGFNTTNGRVVANTGTNVLTFTNSIKFGNGSLIGEYGIYFGTTNDFGINLEEAKIVSISNNPILDFGDGSNIQANWPISFLNTNASRTTRTNLGVGLPLLTNTSITNFQAALFSTNTAPTNTTNVSAWTTIQIGANAFRVPLYQ